MLKIRLRRMGSRHKPFYRVVVSDSRRAPTASALDEIGYYDPRRTPATLQVDLERADHWLSNGAQPSETVAQLIARARTAQPAEEAPAAEAPAPAQAEAETAPAEAAEA